MTHLASRLVVVETVLALLHGRALGLLFHVRLDTDSPADLGLDGEIASSW